MRVSGPGAIKILAGLLGVPKIKLRDIKPRKAYKKTILDENNNPFDDVIVTLYKKPKSYTGEDVLEISCHGSPYIIKYIIDLCINFGANPASPGDFTKRAFINGKIDLMQAESVANMVSASSHRGVNIALNGLRGSLSNEIGVMRDVLVDILSYSEHLLDVSEEDITNVDISYIIDKTEKNVATSTRKDMLKQMKNVRNMPVSQSNANNQAPPANPDDKVFDALIGNDSDLDNLFG